MSHRSGKINGRDNAGLAYYREYIQRANPDDVRAYGQLLAQYATRPELVRMIVQCGPTQYRKVKERLEAAVGIAKSRISRLLEITQVPEGERLNFVGGGTSLNIGEKGNKGRVRPRSSSRRLSTG